MYRRFGGSLVFPCRVLASSLVPQGVDPVARATGIASSRTTVTTMHPDFFSLRLDGRRAAPLALEGLEARYTPTDLAPQIVDFAAQETMPGLFLFSGRVIDESPGGLIVTFGGGPASMQGQSVEVESDGTFALLVQLLTNGDDSGTVEATTVDDVQQTSNTAYAYVTPTPA